MKKNSNIIFFGFKGCGKTFFGSLLAQKINREFIDTDRLIEKAYGGNSNCREIFSKIGVDAFRALEKNVIKSLGNIQQAVLALGGGTLLDNENYHFLKNLGTLVYLELDKEEVKRRHIEDMPSFLDHHNFHTSFEEMYRVRKTLYDALESVKINLNSKNNDQILEEIIKL